MNLKLKGTLSFDIDITGDLPTTPPPGEPTPPPAPLVLPSRAIFPATDPWNTDISTRPVDPASVAMLTNAGAAGTNGLTLGLHPDFGTVFNGVPIGIPYNLVKGTQPKVPVTFTYASESDPGPYPIPPIPIVEPGDAHLILIDIDNWLCYELFGYRFDGTTHRAAAGAIWNLATNTQRPQGWTSADAAGLPIFPGLVRYDEVMEQKAINHALRVTVKRTRRGFVAPATHYASTINDPNFLPMGARIRLDPAYPLTGFSPPAVVILTALKKFGAFVADNGSAFFLTGVPDPRWDNTLLAEIKKVKGSNLQVVQLGPVTASV